MNPWIIAIVIIIVIVVAIILYLTMGTPGKPVNLTTGEWNNIWNISNYVETYKTYDIYYFESETVGFHWFIKKNGIFINRATVGSCHTYIDALLGE